MKKGAVVNFKHHGSCNIFGLIKCTAIIYYSYSLLWIFCELSIFAFFPS